MENIQLIETYKNYSEIEKKYLLDLEKLITLVAKEQDVKLDKSLKWNQLSFSTPSGTPIRIDRFDDEHVAMFVSCQTSLVEEWKELFGDTLSFSKTRAIVLSTKVPLPKGKLAMCIQMSLFYKDRKNRKRKSIKRLIF